MKLPSFFARKPDRSVGAKPKRSRGWLRPRTPWIIAVLIVAGMGFWFYQSSAKILQEPIESSISVSDSQFPGSVGPLLGAEFVRGNSVKPLINGKEIFPAMLDEIRRAEKSITLESYIWASGTVSDQFCAALIERARAGVKVHALVDGAGNLKLKLSDVDRMKEAGIEFVVYGRERAFHLKLDINHRTHRKLLVVDGKVGFTGGVCIDDTWLGDADQEGVWRDTQARVEGPVVRQMQAVFATNWLETTSRLLIGPEYFPELKPTGPALAQCFLSGPGDRPENARLAYLLAIASARNSIRLSQAYFAPDDLAIEMLVAARQRGVRIEIIVPFKNDSRMGRAVSRSRWGKLMEAGVEFHQYMPALYHCKMMIVDDHFVTLGSVNFDNRSFSINDEVNINVVDASVARACLVGFNDDMKNSKPLTKEEFQSRPLWVKTLDHFSGLFRSQF